MAPFDHLQLKHADIFSSPTESANRAAILELFDPHPFYPFLWFLLAARTLHVTWPNTLHQVVYLIFDPAAWHSAPPWRPLFVAVPCSARLGFPTFTRRHEGFRIGKVSHGATLGAGCAAWDSWAREGSKDAKGGALGATSALKWKVSGTHLISFVLIWAIFQPQIDFKSMTYHVNSQRRMWL